VSDVIAVVLFFGITAYALFGGADFGAGFWDLIAGGAEKGDRPRAIVDHSIGPVWEANHVWLIFVLVVLWTSFPEAFGSIMLTLFVPLSLAALGIVLRGASFAFRKEVYRTSSRRNFGAAFASSSVLVPFFMGTVAGAIASGRVPAGGVAGDTWAASLRSRSARTWPRSTWCGTPSASATTRWSSTTGAGRWPSPSSRESSRSPASGSSTTTRGTSSTDSCPARWRS
jgi:cytochrome bd-type quinol oxidase subunit 2